MADAIVSAVAEQIATILKEQIQNEVSLVRGVEKEIDNLSKELEMVRNKLEDAEKKQFADKSVGAWLVRLEDASYEMEDVLDEWHTALRKFQIQQQQQSNNDAPKNKVCSVFSCLCFKKVVVRRDIATKIENVKAKLDKILAEKDRYGLVTSSPSTTTGHSWRPQSISLVDLAQVHGRDIDRDVVASKIFVMASPCQEEIEERQLEIVSIVGVGGVGKTTLAQLIFNDSRVKDCFELPIWICVSDPFDVDEIVKKIVESVTGRTPPISNQSEGLVRCLQACISGKKVLLVLDDVWTEEHNKWETLKISLKSCCGNGSKILVTTRNEKVAKTLDTLENGMHHLGVLSDESCWLLLKRIAFFDKNEDECAAEYEDIGMKIVEKCKGLPLAAKTLGSLLRCKNSLEEWENVLNSEIWKLEEAKVDIFPHLLLSYNELSPALKRCFSYCAVFPKDSEIVAEEVIRKWMALGYLGSDIGGGSDDMELTGRQYFEDLAMRSLFQDFTKDYSGEEIKSFKLHDIVHDFALFLRKNAVEAGANKKTSCQACSTDLVSQVKQYRSLFWDGKDSPIICGCLSSLRVLSLSGNSRIPQGIEKFIHLRWLDLTHIENSEFSIREGLETICNELYNLQTLVLQYCKLEEIPRGIGNLICLRHLNLSWNPSLKELPREIGNLIHLRHLDLSHNDSLEELPENISDMCELGTLGMSYCNKVSKLPQGIHRLQKLKHLLNYAAFSLEQFPQGIAQLTCLRTVRQFRVGRDMGKLGLLKNLTRLGGSLLLLIKLTAGSGNVDVEDARDGELRKKKYLEELEIMFDVEIDIGVEDCVWVEFLDALEPHHNLQSLTIGYFNGSRLPCWIASPLNQVKLISLFNFSRMSSILQPLGKLPCLEKMQISGMHELRLVGREFLGTTTEATIVFPKLKKLTFNVCPNWEEWEDITAQEEDEKAISFMPRLTELSITRCSSLAALPQRLLRKVASSLEKLDIRGSAQLEQRYGDKEGSPWKSISHINPRIQLIIKPHDS